MSSTAINGATYAAPGFFSRLTPILNTVKGLRDQGKKNQNRSTGAGSHI